MQKLVLKYLCEGKWFPDEINTLTVFYIRSPFRRELASNYWVWIDLILSIIYCHKKVIHWHFWICNVQKFRKRCQSTYTRSVCKCYCSKTGSWFINQKRQYWRNFSIFWSITRWLLTSFVKNWVPAPPIFFLEI